MRLRRRSLVAALFLAAAGLVGPPPSGLQAQGSPALSEPGISPDGSEIAFIAAGDIWTVDAQGGVARLLVAHSATESRPLYSPDGRYLAFNSDRDGTTDVFVLELQTGDLTRLTVQDGTERLDGWSPDSEWVYFSSSRTDVAAMTDIFRVRVGGGTPLPVLSDRYGEEFHAAPGSGDRILIATRGRMAYSQWWRRGSSHIDEAEIWMATVAPGVDPVYEPVAVGGKNLWPMWGADGETIYWMSDRDGQENLWRKGAVGGAPSPVTSFASGRLLWPSISRAGDRIAFERDFGIWTWDTDGGAVAVDVTLRGAVEAPGVEARSLDTFSEVALSPDGDKVAVVSRGEVFAAAADSGGTAYRVTRTAAPESSVAWAPDSRRIVYTSTRGEYSHVYLYDFASEEERQLTSASANDEGPEFGPEGDRVAFLRGGRALIVLDVESGAETTLVSGNLSFSSVFTGASNFEWSPDGEWIAHLAWPSGEFGNVFLVPTSGGESRPVSFLANAFAGAVTWTPEGNAVLFSSSQRTEDGHVVQVDLTLRTPLYREDRFRELFRDTEETPDEPGEPNGAGGAATEDESPSPDPVFDNVRRRASLLPLGLDVDDLALSPNGKTLAVLATAEGRQNVYTYALDPLAIGSRGPRQITSTAGRKSGLQFTPDGKTLLFLHDGHVRKVPASGGSEQGLSVEGETRADFEREKGEVFLQGWRLMRDAFYDPDLHGADWDGVRSAWQPRIEAARTVAGLRRLLQLMVGELDGSHLGAGGGNGRTPIPVGYIGARYDRGEYEASGRLRISEIIPLTPAAVTDGLDVGDYLVAVNGAPVGANVNVNALFAGTVGKRTELSVADAANGATRTVVVKPMGNGPEKQLLYRDWVEGRRAYVDSVSGGRLGYVHMQNMGFDALNQLYLDLDQENHDKDGVVIDIRNNNGGFVNAYALDVFTRRSYFSMRPRGNQATSSRLQLGQRALLAPTVLVTNQNTLSDGEDFTEGYRVLGLGRVVGEPTAGWIIYTSSVSLLDGTRFRIPFIEIRGADGEVMERNPRPVDIEVERPAGEGYTGRDVQLDRAVEVLLGQIEGGR